MYILKVVGEMAISAKLQTMDMLCAIKEKNITRANISIYIE